MSALKDKIKAGDGIKADTIEAMRDACKRFMELSTTGGLQINHTACGSFLTYVGGPGSARLVRIVKNPDDSGDDADIPVDTKGWGNVIDYTEADGWQTQDVYIEIWNLNNGLLEESEDATVLADTNQIVVRISGQWVIVRGGVTADTVKEGLLATDLEANGTATLNVYTGAGLLWAWDEETTIEIRDRAGWAGLTGQFCIAHKINGEWRPVAIGCPIPEEEE